MTVLHMSEFRSPFRIEISHHAADEVAHPQSGSSRRLDVFVVADAIAGATS